MPKCNEPFTLVPRIATFVAVHWRFSGYGDTEDRDDFQAFQVSRQLLHLEDKDNCYQQRHIVYIYGSKCFGFKRRKVKY